jgi:hypothetical protein
MGGYHYNSGSTIYDTGGHPNIDKYAYASNANATDVGDLQILNQLSYSQSRYGSYQGGSASSTSHGYTMGGYNEASAADGASNACEKIAFATDSGGVDVGDLVLKSANGYGASDGTYGYYAGGGTDGPSPLTYDMIQSLAYASEAKADTTQNLTGVRLRGAAVQSLTYGYTMGGAPLAQTAVATNIIERYQFATTNHGSDVGDLTAASRETGSSSSTTHGYCHGGTTAVAATKINIIEKVQLVASANSTDVGDTMVTKNRMSGSSSTTHGYTHGYVSTSAGSVDITKYSHSSDGNATDVGDLTKPTSASHYAQF